MNSPSKPENIDQRPVALAEAIARAERLAQEYQAYIDAGQNSHEHAECPKPFEGKAEDVFFDLQKAICSNIRLISLVDIYHITLIIDHMMRMEFIDPSDQDANALANQMADIFNILEARKRTQQLFEGEGLWGVA